MRKEIEIFEKVCEAQGKSESYCKQLNADYDSLYEDYNDGILDLNDVTEWERNRWRNAYLYEAELLTTLIDAIKRW